MPTLRVSCSNPLQARPGDLVELDCASPPAGWLTLVLLAYGVPVLMLVLGALLGHALALPSAVSTDGAAAGGALVG